MAARPSKGLCGACGPRCRRIAGGLFANLLRESALGPINDIARTYTHLCFAPEDGHQPAFALCRLGPTPAIASVNAPPALTSLYFIGCVELARRYSGRKASPMMRCCREKIGI